MPSNHKVNGTYYGTWKVKGFNPFKTMGRKFNRMGIFFETGPFEFGTSLWDVVESKAH